MEDIPGWVRLDGMHRNNGSRARITYERIAEPLPPKEDEKSEPDAVQPVHPVQTELDFDHPFEPPDPDAPLPF